MFKMMLLSAIAAVSVCAMAQTPWQDKERRESDATGKSYWEIKRIVCDQDWKLSGGDAYDFEIMLERMPGTAENALVSALFSAHRQSVLIRDQIIASMFPGDDMVVANTTTMDQAVLAEETENSMRPMRMVMQKNASRDIDYDTAFSILKTDLSDTQATQLWMWWSSADDHQKDIIVRLLKADARSADDPIYPSLYVHHVYEIIPIN